MKNALLAHLEAINAKTAAWVAEDPTNRWASCYVTDLAHWEGYGVRTVEDFIKHSLVSEVFELTRSACGYKPSWSGLMAQTVEELSKESDYLQGIITREIEAEKLAEQREAQAIADAFTTKTCTLGDIWGAVVVA